jgi:hypothetical protein
MSAPAFRNGVTVTVMHRFVSGVDDFGNDVFSETPTAVDACSVQPFHSEQDQTQLKESAYLYMPAGTPVTYIDEVIVDGERWEVDAAPDSWTSPFTGHQGVVQVTIRKITGASQGQQD